MREVALVAAVAVFTAGIITWWRRRRRSRWGRADDGALTGEALIWRADQDRDRGAQAVEYGLLVVFIAATGIAVTVGIGHLVEQAFVSPCAASVCSPAPVPSPTVP